MLGNALQTKPKSPSFQIGMKFGRIVLLDDDDDDDEVNTQVHID